MRHPVGLGLRRKLSVLGHLPGHLSTIARHARAADAIHVPPPGDLPLLGMLVALGLGKRLIARYCASWVKTSETTMTNRVMRAAAGGPNVMLATGEAERPPAAGIHWIFATGISTDELAGISPVKERGLSTPPQLAYVGRLSEEKGVGNLIRAMARLEAEGFAPLPRIRLIGDGPERDHLEAEVSKRNLQRLFRFEGQLDRSQLSRALEESDFTVQPSLTEGYCKAWLDAFAHGLPVLSTVAGAARVVIGESGERGWLVPAGDVNALADQLRRVLSEPQDWATLRRRCRQFAEDRTLEVWAARIGRLCSEQWGLVLAQGRLALPKVAEHGGRDEQSRGSAVSG
jgi:glycosyltransferase involved in cell wall biosynthesis